MAKAVFDELTKARAEERLHRRHQRRRLAHQPRGRSELFDIEPDDVVRALFYGLGADGTVGREQEHVKIIAEDPAMLCAGLFRLRLAEVRRPDDLPPALRPAADPRAVPDRSRRTSSAATSSTFLSGIDMLRLAAPGRHVPAQQPLSGRTRSGTSCRGRCSSRSSTSKLQASSSSTPPRWRTDSASARASTPILQTCFFAHLRRAAARQGDRGDQARDREDLWHARATKSSRRTSRRSTATLAHLHEVRVPPKAAGSAIAAAGRPGRRAGVRAQRHGHDPALARRRPPGQRDSGRRHLPTGTTAYEKRNIADEVPVWEPISASSAASAPSSARTASSGPNTTTRAASTARRRLSRRRRSTRAAIPTSRFTLQVLCRGLHRVRRLRGELPGAQPDRRRGQGDQHGTERRIIETGRASIAFFETLPWADRTRVNFANVRGVQFLRAAVRVLRRLRRVRRDAVSQAAVAALRRPPADRQRDRLLVDLRRQPADDALGDERRRARAGVGQLAVRGQCRVRPRLSPGHRQPDRAWREQLLAQSSRRDVGEDLGPRRSWRRRR